ncbi:MAG: hypothetical protein PF904_13855 [Kiritimatiellae bacterium]|jgi:hypothetical protein|nr:hypothetical protein [Kiritimatiellia bacterium]
MDYKRLYVVVYITELSDSQYSIIKSDFENQKAGKVADKIKDILEYKEKSITHYTSLATAKILLMPAGEDPALFRLSNAIHLNDPSLEIMQPVIA